MAELQFNEADEVESADDVSFPSYAHHFKVRGELSELVELDLISEDEADDIFTQWREDRNQ